MNQYKVAAVVMALVFMCALVIGVVLIVHSVRASARAKASAEYLMPSTQVVAVDGKVVGSEMVVAGRSTVVLADVVIFGDRHQ